MIIEIHSRYKTDNFRFRKPAICFKKCGLKSREFENVLVTNLHV